MQNDNVLVKTVGRPALHESNAERQKAYRQRLLDEGLVSVTVLLSNESIELLKKFEASKKFSSGQFSRYSFETKSQTIDRAIKQFLRKR